MNCPMLLGRLHEGRTEMNVQVTDEKRERKEKTILWDDTL